MFLFIVQHAQAKSEQEDIDRHLSEKGLSDIRKVSSFLSHQKELHINIIFHSGKTRTKQTAEVLAEYLNLKQNVKEIYGLKPMDDPKIWIDRLNEFSENIMLVGHLPHLKQLTNFLLCGNSEKNIIDFQMGGVLCLERDETNNWILKWNIVPFLVD